MHGHSNRKLLKETYVESGALLKEKSRGLMTISQLQNGDCVVVIDFIIIAIIFALTEIYAKLISLIGLNKMPNLVFC